jgi:hypothetical protein
MHAHEINDPKIDPKFDIREAYTIQKMMDEGSVRPASALSLKEIKNLYGEILRQEALILQCNPLPQTIYTFTYMSPHAATSITMTCGRVHHWWPLWSRVSTLWVLISTKSTRIRAVLRKMTSPFPVSLTGGTSRLLIRS